MAAVQVAPAAPREREALPAWPAASTQRLPDAPREAGPDRGCWTWSTCCAGTAAWPHEPTVVDHHAAEGRSWRLTLSADGTRVTRLPMPTAAGEAPDAAAASARGTAGELVLALYGRIPVDSLKLEGDRRVFDLLLAWEPEDQDVPMRRLLVCLADGRRSPYGGCSHGLLPSPSSIRSRRSKRSCTAWVTSAYVCSTACSASCMRRCRRSSSRPTNQVARAAVTIP